MSSAWLSSLAKISVLGTLASRPSPRRFPVLEDDRQRVAQGAHHLADLVGGHHPAVQLGGAVVDVLVHLLQAELAGVAVAEPGHELGRDGAARLGDLGADAEHVEVHVHPVGHRLGVPVLHHQVLVEERERLDARRGCEPHQERVEVLQHLAPHPVDRAVALVDDDQVVGLDRHLRVVGHLHRLGGLDLEAGALVEVIVEALRVVAPQDREQPLDGADVHLRRRLGSHVHPGVGEVADVVQLAELAGIVGRCEALEFPQRLTAQVGPVHQEQDPGGIRVAHQPVAGVGRRERLARPGGHLDQRPRTVLAQRRLQVSDRLGLRRPQVWRVGLELGQVADAEPQRRIGDEPSELRAVGVGADPAGQRLGPMEREHPPGRRHRVEPAGEAGLGAG